MESKYCYTLTAVDNSGEVLFIYWMDDSKEKYNERRIYALSRFAYTHGLCFEFVRSHYRSPVYASGSSGIALSYAYYSFNIGSGIFFNDKFNQRAVRKAFFDTFINGISINRTETLFGQC